jgi:copper(I)-binding protein
MEMKNMKYQLCYLIALGVILLAACGPAAADSPQISVEDAWVRAAARMDTGNDASGMDMGASTSAAYMLLQNSGKQADALISVSTDIAETVELHTSEMKDGIMTMSMVDEIEVPARGKAEFKPAGMHIMLINLTQDLTPGQKVNLTLNFKLSGKMVVEAEVRAP